MDTDSFQVIKDGYQKFLGKQLSSFLETWLSASVSIVGLNPKICHSDLIVGLRSTLLLNNINPRSLLSVAAGWTPAFQPYDFSVSPMAGDLTVVDELGLASKAPQPELGYFGWYPWLGNSKFSGSV